MIADIIVGATYGDEGKSKFARYYSDNVVKYVGAIKIGGYCTNNFYDWRTDSIMTNHMLPAATGNRDEIYFIFPRGSYVDVDVLKKEMEMRKIPKDRIIIDDMARIVTLDLIDDVVGWNYAKTLPPDVGTVMNLNKFFSEWDSSSRFLVEGQGGYGLAKEFYTEYHKVIPMLPPTMTASGIASLLNIAPSEVDDVILVSRIESTRKEILPHGDAWDILLSGVYETRNLCIDISSPETEPYNMSLVREAIIANDPSILVLNHLDTVESNQDDPNVFTDRQYDILAWIEQELGASFDYVGYGEREISELVNSESGNNELDKAIDQFNELLEGENVGKLLESLNLKEGDLIPNDLLLQLMNQPKTTPIMVPPSQITKMEGGNNNA